MRSADAASKLKWFDAKKGFGFVETESGDVFLHARRVRPEERDRLVPGVLLEFSTAMEPKGRAAFDARVVRDGKARE